MGGQASTEYVGVVGLVALVLSVAGAVAAPDLPSTVARHVRVALCIVGGDVCRAGDARRAGLEPCVVSVREADRHTTINAAVLTYGSGKGYAIERRSDGTRRVLVTNSNEGGLTAGAGVKLGAHVAVGAEVSGAVGWSSGYGWDFPDEPALQRFLAGVRQSPGRLAWDLAKKRVRPPTERYEAATGDLSSGIGANALGLEQVLAAASGRAALGRRRGSGGRTSWFFDAGHDGPRLFGGIIPGIELRGPGAWVLELSNRPKELRMSTAAAPAAGRVAEVEARLDLRVPANAAVARELLSGPTPARAGAIGRHMLAAGTVHRREYRVRELPSEPEVAVKLGLAGVDHSGTAQERTLVAADVLRAGSPARRADCLGL